MGISTRPAVASDEEFVNALTRETMRPYVEATWPSDEEREEYYWLNRFQQNETEIMSFTASEGTTLGDQWGPVERLRRDAIDRDGSESGGSCSVWRSGG